MITEYLTKFDKENSKDFDKFFVACNKDVKVARRIHILWETSSADPTDVGLKNPKSKWQVFADQAHREGFTKEQLDLFLMYSS